MHTPIVIQTLMTGTLFLVRTDALPNPIGYLAGRQVDSVVQSTFRPIQPQGPPVSLVVPPLQPIPTGDYPGRRPLEGRQVLGFAAPTLGTAGLAKREISSIMPSVKEPPAAVTPSAVPNQAPPESIIPSIAQEPTIFPSQAPAESIIASVAQEPSIVPSQAPAEPMDASVTLKPTTVPFEAPIPSIVPSIPSEPTMGQPKVTLEERQIPGVAAPTLNPLNPVKPPLGTGVYAKREDVIAPVQSFIPPAQPVAPPAISVAPPVQSVRPPLESLPLPVQPIATPIAPESEVPPPEAPFSAPLLESVYKRQAAPSQPPVPYAVQSGSVFAPQESLAAPDTPVSPSYIALPSQPVQPTLEATVPESSGAAVLDPDSNAFIKRQIVGSSAKVDPEPTAVLDPNSNAFIKPQIVGSSTKVDSAPTYSPAIVPSGVAVPADPGTPPKPSPKPSVVA